MSVNAKYLATFIVGATSYIYFSQLITPLAIKYGKTI